MGDEYQNLSPSFRVAAALPDAITPQQLRRIENITLANADLRREIPIMSVPFKNVDEIPGKHQRLSITVPASQTAAILTACRNLSLSVTHAYHTAIAMAVRDTQPSEPTPSLKRYINYCLINERSRCKPPTTPPPTPQQSTTPSPAPISPSTSPSPALHPLARPPTVKQTSIV